MKKLISLAVVIVIFIGLTAGPAMVEKVKEGSSSPKKWNFSLIPKISKAVEKSDLPSEEIERLQQGMNQQVDTSSRGELILRLLLFDKWGSPRSAIELIEKGSVLVASSDSSITYQSQDILYTYYFNGGGLISTSLEVNASSPQEHIKQFNDLRDSISNLYGTASTEMLWNNKNSKYIANDLKWGTALEVGDLELWAIARNNQSKVYLSTSLKNGKLVTTVEAFSNITVQEQSGTAQQWLNDLLNKNLP